MDMDDFRDNFKYKLIPPFMYIFNWVLMFVGPFIFPAEYQMYCIVLLIWLFFRGLVWLVGSVVACYRSNVIMNRAEKLKTELPDTYDPLRQQIIHAFIIPSYKEDEALLEDTLNQLAIHPQAKERYLVFLGMEGHE